MTVPDRYCRNCGNELRETDRFCPNCATPVQEAAHVPTPEADVEVPPPPQQDRPTAGDNRTRNLLLMLAGLIGVIWFFASIGEDSGGGSAQSGGASGSASPASSASVSASAQGGGSGETFTNENYAELYSDPDAHEGAKVDVA